MGIEASPKTAEDGLESFGKVGERDVFNSPVVGGWARRGNIRVYRSRWRVWNRRGEIGEEGGEEEEDEE